MDNFDSRLNKKVAIHVAKQANKIQSGLIESMADDIQKDRVELIKKAMSKQRSLTGQMYKDAKPDVPGTWTKNSEGVAVQSDPTWSSKEAMEKAVKLRANLEKLDEAIEACLSATLPEDADAAAQETFAKEDKARWETLKKLTNKEDKDNYAQW